MKIIFNSLIPPGNFAAINLFGVLFVRHGVALSPSLLNHETIHTRQMVELLVVGFYIAYVIEWIVRLPMCGFDLMRAYRSISFEREAYANDSDLGYLSRRRPFSFLKYYRK